MMTEDIEPQRMSVIDVAVLTDIECYAVLVTMACDRDPVIAAALIRSVTAVLARTRG